MNVIGSGSTMRNEIAACERRVAEVVETEITHLGIEHNARGERAKAYLYCLETVDPQTGWLAPLAPSWVISRNRKSVARLVPDHSSKHFDILIDEQVTDDALESAKIGTVRDGFLVYELAPVEGGEVREWRISIPRLRHDGEGPVQPDGSRGNLLRRWDISEVAPRPPQWVPDAAPVVDGAASDAWVGGDIWQERLYCIQWMDAEDLRKGKARPETHFAAPDDADLARETQVAQLVSKSLRSWQADGLVPNMQIEPGVETLRLTRERGWTYWHHLFTPRHLFLLAIVRANATQPTLFLRLCSLLNRTSRLTQWHLRVVACSCTVPAR